jgi:hypothetical protein
LEVFIMALVKKKELPPAPGPELRVALVNEARLLADENGVFCHAAFQTEEAITPRMWELLVKHAQRGGVFDLKMVMVEPVEGSD